MQDTTTPSSTDPSGPSGGARAWLRKAAHACYVFTPLPLQWKNRIAHGLYGVTGWIFRGDRNYELWNRANTGRQIAVEVAAVRDEDIDALLREIRFPPVAQPVVSIIIPAYGNIHHTLACLRSIHCFMPAVAIEVIVAEDASGDPQILRLREIEGLRFLVNARNLGFLRSCNAAAGQARGRYLHFLNNDTEVTKGWLDAMLRLFATEPDCGMVGSMLVFPDGRLQEAGAYVRPDGWTVQHGKGAEPVEAIAGPGRHIVDYCSAACLLVRRDLFLALGGFDPLYDPAYFEDVDLMFRMRARGFYTYLCGDVEVTHEENVTSRKVWDEERRTQVVTAGHGRFVGRWGGYLADRLFKAAQPPSFPAIDWRPAPTAAPAGEVVVLRGPGLIADRPEWNELIRQAGPPSQIGHVVFEADEACSRMRVYTLAARAGVALGSFEVRRARG